MARGKHAARSQSVAIRGLEEEVQRLTAENRTLRDELKKAAGDAEEITRLHGEVAALNIELRGRYNEQELRAEVTRLKKLDKEMMDMLADTMDEAWQIIDRFGERLGMTKPEMETFISQTHPGWVHRDVAAAGVVASRRLDDEAVERIQRARGLRPNDRSRSGE